MNNNEQLVPISEKYLLSVKEAAAYFGIGEKRIRFLVNTTPGLGRRNGDKILVHRKNFENYLDEVSSI